MNKEFKDEHMMKLQGKNYLPVAPRVLMFRQDHPEAVIHTQTQQVGEDTYVYAIIGPAGMSDVRVAWATAHKRIRKDAKGPAGQWPLETAETGAIGRALALCGYGTLAGELDEGDQLADAPVEAQNSSKVKSKSQAATEDKYPAAIALMQTANTRDELASLKPKLRGMADEIRADGDEDGRRRLVAEVKAYEQTLQA